MGSERYLLCTNLDQASLTFDDIVLNEIHTTRYLDAFDNKVLARTLEIEPDLARLSSARNEVLLAKTDDVIDTACNLRDVADAFGDNTGGLHVMYWVLANGSVVFLRRESFQDWLDGNGKLDNPFTEEQFWMLSILIASKALLAK